MVNSTPKKRVLFARSLTPILLAVFGVFSLLVINLHTPQMAVAAASDTVNFQARLQSHGGAVVPDGDYNIEFKLYDTDSSSGSSQGSCTGDSDCLWTEDYTGANVVTVKDGYLSVRLGSITAFPDTIDWSQQLYLTMNIGGTGTPSWDGEMDPRLALTATPYSFLSQRATTADNADQLSTTNSNGTNTLSIQGPGSSEPGTSFVLQDQAAGGTFYLLTSDTSGNVDVSGLATAASIETGSVDRSSSGTLSIGTTHATALALGSTTSNIGTTINGTAVVKSTSSNTSGAFQVQDSSSNDLFDVDTDTDTVNIGAAGSTALASVVNIATTSTSAHTQTVTIGDSASNGVTTLRSNGITQTITGDSTHASDVIKGNSDGLFQVQDASTNTLFGIDSTNGAITFGTLADGIDVINNGAALYGMQTLTDFATGGGDMTDAAHINKYTAFAVPQITPDISLLLPSPTTNTSDAHIIFVSDTGTADINVAGTTIAAGNFASFMWNQAIGEWSSASASASSSGGFVTLQSSSPGSPDSGSLNVSGTGTFGNTLTDTVSNSVTNAASLVVNQTGTGDSTIQLENSVSNNSYFVGVDHSASDTFKIASTTSNGGSGSALVGSHTGGNGDDNGNNNMLSATLVHTTVSGSVSTIHVTVTVANAGHMQVGLYADNGSQTAPTTLLAHSSEVALSTATTYNFTIPTYTVTANTYYWIAFDVDNAGIKYAWAGNNGDTLKAVYTGSGDVPYTSDATMWSDSQATTFNAVNTHPTYGYEVGMDVEGSAPDQFTGSLFSLTQTGAAAFQNSTDSTSAFQVQNASGVSMLAVDTTDSTVTIGDATAGGQLTNNGATLNKAKSLGNVTTTFIGGSNTNSVAAAASVDKYTAFTIAQSSGSVSASIPTPTNTTAGRIIYIASLSSSTQNITVGGITLKPGNDSEFLWNGSAWNATAVSTGASLVGSFTGASIANGASISGNTITFGAADGTNPGLVTTGTQSFAGAKTFTSGVTVSGSTLQANAGFGATGGTIGLGTASGDTVTIGNTNSTNAITLKDKNITQTITGDTTTPTDIIKGNSTGLFQVQSSASATPVLGVDTADGRVGINVASPAYALDVNGVINSNTSVDVNGVAVCTTSCIPSSGSGNYVQNGATVQTNANLFIRGVGSTTPTAQVQGASGQTGDLLDLETWNGSSSSTIDSFDSSGNFAINTATLQSSGSVMNISDTATLTSNGGSISGQLVNVSRNLTANISGGGGAGTPTLDNSAALNINNTASYTSSYTVNSGHNDYYLMVSITEGTDNGIAPSAPTYGGHALSLIGSSQLGAQGATDMWIYALVGPLTGSNTLAITNPGTTTYAVNVTSWYNVNQTTPLGGSMASAGNTSTASPTLTSIAWTAGHVIVDNSFMAIDSSTTCPNTAPGTGQTQAVNNCQTGGGVTIGTSYITATGGSQTITWHATSGTVANWWQMNAFDLVGDTTVVSETVSSPVAAFSDNCTLTAGICTDASNVMQLQQQYSGATGAVLKIQNAGSGDMLDLANGSGTVLDSFSANGSLTVGGSLTIGGTLAGSVVSDSVSFSATNSVTVSGTGFAYNLVGTVGNAGATVKQTFNLTGLPTTTGSVVYIMSAITKTAGTNSNSVAVTINGNVTALSTVSASSTTTAHEDYTIMYDGSTWHIVGYGPASGSGTAENADFAEWIDYSGDSAPQPGDVLTVGDDYTTVKDSDAAYDSHLIGVVSSNPYEVGGADDGHSIILALTGRVPVKVSTENGPIEPGDPLTSSSTPGVAMKATEGGQIIGTALEAYDGTQGSDEINVQLHPGYDNPDPGTIQGDANIGGGLYVAGSADIEGNLTVAGTTTTQNLAVSGHANLTVLTVSGGVNADSVTVIGQASAATLAVSGDASFGGDITLNGHFITGGTAPTTAVNTATAGSTATCTVAGNDTSGTIALQAQGTGQAAGAQCTLTFTKAFGTAPRTVLSPNDSASGTMGAYLQSTPTTMTLNFTGVPVAGQTYNYNYFAPQ
ncbi:MAG TPA: hypothetical protein VGM08_02655 [Candidatus Saccharimonadales bacterium]|jgi:cytoskeletal protein CcmA (bactofilin family)